MKGNRPRVSIITPVYNGEKYLAECIESIIRQTWDNWDYLIVDNGSTDGTPDIISDYANRDSRIRVITNEHTVGVIENHNIAFDAISSDSDYCKLVQADDWLFDDCIEQMVGAGEKAPSAGVIGSYCLSGRRVRCDGLPYSKSVIPGTELARETLLGNIYLFWSPSCLMLRSELVTSRRPFFRSSYLHADIEALYEILQHHDFAFVHQVLTYIRTHEMSMTRQDAMHLNTQCLSRLHLLSEYGAVFLGKDEYISRQGELLQEYYRFLAAAIFRKGRASFWEYQKTELQKIGYSWSRARLLGALLIELMGNPRPMVRTVKSRLVREVSDRAA